MAFIKIQDKAVIQGKTVFDTGYSIKDSDAATYIEAVETADGQTLENGVKEAIDAFVLGCKSDSIWSALKASCILAGARTLDGALVPLVGSSPTNNNFVSGDYNRETGLVGNGSTKRLHTNRNQDDDPQDDMHVSVFFSTQGTYYHMGGSGSNPSQLIDYRTRNRASALQAFVTPSNYLTYSPNTLFGMSRSSSSEYSVRQINSSYTFSQTSGTPTSNPYYVFNSGASAYSTSRLSFYSIGEALDLSKLDSRVSTLMTDIAAAI